MARDAQSADDAYHTPRSEEKQGRRPSRTERDERRRLSEREQVSGEIRTPTTSPRVERAGWIALTGHPPGPRADPR
ncbi:hypothetical protein [Nesterenkonia pannonica]|uniref:hypothetical protein n=1 Tax=Nesterenkonia pannonica TaxID=1548602 RepID=UPI0021643CAF|nr:hypothetical protein [Nesterenkonia pannonica]